MRQTKSHAAADAERSEAVASDTGSRVRSREPRVEPSQDDQELTRMVTYESTRDGQIAKDETRATRRKLAGREMGWDEEEATYVYATLEDEPLRGEPRPQLAPPHALTTAAPTRSLNPNAPPQLSALPTAVRIQEDMRALEQRTHRTLPNAHATAASLQPPAPAASMPVPTPTRRIDRQAKTQSLAAINWLPAYEPGVRAALLRKLAISAAVLGGAVLVFLAVRMFAGAPVAGTVQVMTEPIDAQVTLDGVLAHGSTSPFVLSGVKLDVAHTIVVSKPGYRSWSTRLTLRSERPVLLPNVLLARESSDLGPLVVTTRYAATAPPAVPQLATLPAGARLAPRTRTRVRPIARSSAHAPAPQSPARTSGTRQAGGSATLRINSRPWSQVYVDGRLIGATPQMNIVLAAGPHTVTLVNPDFRLKRVIALPLEPGQTITKVVDLSN